MMNFDDLASSDTTTVELRHPITNEPTGVLFTGYTPDSAQWLKASKAGVNPNKKQSLILGKKGDNRIELDNDATEKRKNLLIKMITNIEGIGKWKYNTDNAKQMLNDPKYSWMLEQWGEHLDSRENFFQA
ncbi:MAG: hypothetical protein GY941_19820 [Planctomycetes bacterium]|nr:hypothetical protein [Planctomycetota bacterium]